MDIGLAFDTQGFLRKVADRTIHVGIIGLGYVGLPLALAFVERARIRVTGFDLNKQTTDSLNAGHSHIKHLGQHRVRDAMTSGLFDATDDFARLDEPDALLIAVPTPLTRQREPDMHFVADTGEAIAKRLRRGQLVVLESTSYPGATDELLRPILERNGLQAGADFLLAFSPEREDPGNRDFSTASIPKLVGGVDASATELATTLYRIAIDRVVPVASARIAEAAKLTENIFRSVNIALVNELKVIYARMGIDIWDVLDAAETKPFGFMRFDPGPGLGGHCIPFDPFYLTWKAREFQATTRFIELAGEINIAMPRYVFERLREALNQRKKAINCSRVLVLGVAYKRDIDDLRESPALELMQLLRLNHARVSYHDPHVLTTPPMRAWPASPPLKSVELTPEVLQSSDAVVLVTDHSSVDYALVLANATLIVDTRGVFRASHPNVVKA